jgi:TolB-like protein/lipoprotein NlpI
MPANPNKLSQFWQELKRRKVVRVITVYAAASFVILELTDIVAPSLGLPDWTLNFIIILLCIGLVIAIILSWIYDIHPEGVIVKTEPAHKVKEEDKLVSSNSWKVASYISFVVIIALIVLNILPRINPSADNSIAVLPFEDMSPEQDQEYFCDGITEEIINSLSQVDALKVIARTSSFSFKGKHEDIREIGRMLDVETLVQGSIQKVKNQLRITAQLIKVEDGSNLWSQQFDRELKDIFAIQDEISAAIIKNLKVELLGEKMPISEKRQTENIEAFNLYLQGRHLWTQERRDDLDKSIEYYKRALEIDPNYALAYSGIAMSYNTYAWHGYFPRKDVVPQAKTAAMKALEIDNTLGEAHTELAVALHILDWDWSGSEEGYKRALELNPNYARAHSMYAWLLTNVGRLDEAIEESKRAHELDPLSVEIWVEFGRRYYFVRDYDKAIEEYRKVLELFPNYGYYTSSELALSLSQKGLHDEAIEEYSKIEFEPTYHWHLGYIYGVAGKREKALEILNYYLELSKKEFVWPASIAFIYIGLGEKDKAFEWLEKTYEQREAWLDQLKVDPMFDSLRSDPRFQDLLERMNFPD